MGQKWVSPEKFAYLYTLGDTVFGASSRGLIAFRSGESSLAGPAPRGALHHFGKELTYSTGSNIVYVSQSGQGYRVREEDVALDASPWDEVLRNSDLLAASSHNRVAFFRRDSDRWVHVRTETGDTQTIQKLFPVGPSSIGVNFGAMLVYRDATSKPEFFGYEAPTSPDQAIALANGSFAHIYREGVTIFNPGASVRNWTARLGLTEPVVKAERSGDRLLAATELGLFRLDPASAQANPCRPAAYRAWPSYFCRAENAPQERYYELRRDRDGSLWAITRQQQLIRLTPEGTLDTALPIPPGIPLDARQIAFTRDHRIFVAAKKGMLEIVSTPALRAIEVPEFPLSEDKNWPNYVADFSASPDGVLWAAVEGGLARYYDGHWVRERIPCLAIPHTRTLAVESENSIWIAYRDVRPMTHLKRSSPASAWQCRQLNAEDGISPGTTCLRIDRQRRIWRGATESLFVARLDSATPPYSGSDWIELGGEIGLMPGAPGLDGFTEDDQGDLWVATRNGLSRLRADGIPRWDPDQAIVVAVERNHSWDWLTNEGWHLSAGSDPVRKLYLAEPSFTGAPPTRPVFWRAIGQWGNAVTDWQPALNGVVDLTNHSGRVGRVEFRSHSQALLGEFVIPGGRWYDIFPLSWWVSLGFLSAAGSSWALLKTKLGAVAKFRFRQWVFGLVGEDRPERIEPLLSAGVRLQGRYEVLDLLARGGFAEVYTALDAQNSSEKLVLKVLRTEHPAFPEFGTWIRNKFMREVEVMQRVNAPGVIRCIHGWIEPDGKPVLVMPFVEGPTLRAFLASQPDGRVPVPLALEILTELAESLNEVHKARVVHGDVKPENIILSRDADGHWHTTLIDFGTSRLRLEAEAHLQTLQPVGTIHYMAPEQFLGFVSEATDLYALAITSFEMLTGRRFRELLVHHNRDWEANLHEAIRGLPQFHEQELRNHFIAAVNPYPGDRPTDLLDWARRFRELIDNYAERRAN